MREIVGSDAGQQRFMALNQANRVRLARAGLKKRICEGKLSAAAVIRECPWEAHNMAVSDVLMSQKRWGATRCRRLLVAAGIPENKAVGTLTERQRTALVAMLNGPACGERAEEDPRSRPPVVRERVLSPA